MCRLFGFHAQTAIRPPYLGDGEGAFVRLSELHKDGWGLAWYEQTGDEPARVRLERSLRQAKCDSEFEALSAAIETQTLIAHLRLATIGGSRVVNNHPFRFGDWTFAHNGNIKHFDKYRELILSQISPVFRASIRGDTDSELIFYFLLSELERWGLVSARYRHSVRQLGQTVKYALEQLLGLIGPWHPEIGPPSETYISFLLSNGQVLLAHQGGQPLYYRTHAQAAAPELLSDIAFCSEPLGLHPDWHPMQTGDLIAVDKRLQLYPIKGY